MNHESALSKTIWTVLSMLFALLFLIPIIWMIMVSIKPQSTIFSSLSSSFTAPFTLNNFRQLVFGSSEMHWMMNSVLVAVISTFVALLFASMSAFALSKIRFSGSRTVYFIYMAGLMIPTEATVIPLYIIAKNLGLLNSFSGLVLPSISLPLAIVILKNFFDSIPQDLLDSANIDGCGWLRCYWNIVMPLSKTSLSALGIFIFVQNWNNFLWPFLALSSEEIFTLPVGVPVFNSSYSANYILPMAANTLASIPIIIVYILFEKQIVKGITMSGIKG